MKKILMIMSVVLLFIIGGLGVEVNASVAFDGKTLDTGIYWFGKDDAAQKYISGQYNPYFNPNKPTMIFLHGWQMGSTQQLNRTTFDGKNNELCLRTSKNLANYWIDKGWNIGIFYWNQLADEGEVRDAEKKIWSNNTSIGLRWRKVDGSYSPYTGSEKSVTEMFVKDYKECMKNFNGSEIRLVGHSLGNQLATNAAKLINDSIAVGQISNKLMPNRVALLEPFWSKGEKDYLGGKWNGELCREYVKSLKSKGTVFEMYKMSNINDLWVGDSNDEMKRLAVYSEVYPDFTGPFNQAAKHNYGVIWYMYSQGVYEPRQYYNNVLIPGNAPSAAMHTEEMRKLENSGYYWSQRGGKNTLSPEDDTFDKLFIW